MKKKGRGVITMTGGGGGQNGMLGGKERGVPVKKRKSDAPGRQSGEGGKGDGRRCREESRCSSGGDKTGIVRKLVVKRTYIQKKQEKKDKV